MSGKYTNGEEKIHILVWRQENVPIKVMCERSGRRKATIKMLLIAVKELSNNTVLKHNLVEKEERHLE